jgi:glycosyltransferase involved in cell wall biosynthesis
MEREIGLDSRSLCLLPSQFRFQSDEVLFRADDGLLHKEIKLWRLVRRALRSFDVIHYNFGRSLLHPIAESARCWPPAQALRTLLGQGYRRLFAQSDVRLLKRAGKAIVVTYQGDDARQGDYCLAHFEITFAREVEPGYYSPESDASKRRQIAGFGHLADRIWAVNPDLLHVLPPQARFLPYANLDPREFQPVIGEPPARPLVLHAPSHRGVKGTRHVLEAIEQLRQEGVPFEFELVENLSHEEARRRYVRADLVIDQLLAGWYGGLAVEAMALGKPVIAYLREGDLGFLPPGMRQDLPLIHATPASIRDVLRSWLTTRRNALPNRGSASRAFVERWHDARAIARMLADDYAAILVSRGIGRALASSSCRTH